MYVYERNERKRDEFSISILTNLLVSFLIMVLLMI